MNDRFARFGEPERLAESSYEELQDLLPASMAIYRNWIAGDDLLLRGGASSRMMAGDIRLLSVFRRDFGENDETITNRFINLAQDPALIDGECIDKNDGGRFELQSLVTPPKLGAIGDTRLATWVWFVRWQGTPRSQEHPGKHAAPHPAAPRGKGASTGRDEGGGHGHDEVDSGRFSADSRSFQLLRALSRPHPSSCTIPR